MDGTRMIPNARYLLRIKTKQVPVIYNGFAIWTAFEGKKHAFTRIDTGEWVFKRQARAVSKHYDDCCFMAQEQACTCHQRLEALRGI